jgi:hypothetical protein
MFMHQLSTAALLERPMEVISISLIPPLLNRLRREDGHHVPLITFCLAPGPIPRRKPEAAQQAAAEPPLHKLHPCPWMDKPPFSVHHKSSSARVTTHSAWRVRTEWSSCRRARCPPCTERFPATPIWHGLLPFLQRQQSDGAALEGDTVLAAPCFRWIRPHESSY